MVFEGFFLLFKLEVISPNRLFCSNRPVFRFSWPLLLFLFLELNIIICLFLILRLYSYLFLQICAYCYNLGMISDSPCCMWFSNSILSFEFPRSRIVIVCGLYVRWCILEVFVLFCQLAFYIWWLHGFLVLECLLVGILLIYGLPFLMQLSSRFLFWVVVSVNDLHKKELPTIWICAIWLKYLFVGVGIL